MSSSNDNTIHSAQPLNVAEIPSDTGASASPLVTGGAWETGLFFDWITMLDWKDLVAGVLYPCVIFGRNAEMMGYDYQKSCVNYCLIFYCPLSCNCIIHAPLRAEIRARFGIEESRRTELLNTCCCSRCSLFQEYIQLKRVERNE